MEKMTWISKIKAALKGGDDAKLSRMNTRVDKYLAKQITARKESISELKEKLEDKQEELTNFVNTVDFEKLTSDTVENYSVSYVNGVLKKVQEIEELEENIKDIENEISLFKKAEKAIYAEYVAPAEEKK